ncbi:MAG: hypothetical protein OEW97_02350 [Gammaproteobacteria bacterium]|nr:hypothetical protein [Gammaproteobacteria bacterium]
MSFLFETVALPFWVLVFIFGSAGPLWFKWYKKFHVRFIKSGLLLKKFRRAKSTAEMKVDILKKATEHWNTHSDLSSFSASKNKKRNAPKKKIDPEKKQNVQIILKELAAAGEVGILPKSISDKTGIKTLETTAALNYLTEKKYAEVINSSKGSTYYLTKLGRDYCINKKYLSED